MRDGVAPHPATDPAEGRAHPPGLDGLDLISLAGAPGPPGPPDPPDPPDPDGAGAGSANAAALRTGPRWPIRHAVGARRAPVWPELLVTAAALAVLGRHVGVPSPWRDETATMAATRRSVAELFELTQNIDRVHLVFYLLTRAALEVQDTLTAARLVSVVAMALAAGLLASLGRRLVGTGVGLTAGAVLLALPMISRWAQDARPAAVTTLLAVASTWWLTEAVRAPGIRTRWSGYALCVVALGYVNVLGLLVVAAHAAYLLVAEPVHLLRRWLWVVSLTAIPLGPWLLLTFGQRDQVSWIETPALHDLTGVYVNAFGSRLPVAAVLVGGLAAVVVSRGLPRGAAGRALVLGASWAVLPPALLWAASLAVPLWDAHYVVFALPGLALLVAAEVAVLTDRIGRRSRDPDAGTWVGRSCRRVPRLLPAVVAAAVVAAVAVAGLPDQRAYRDASTGHGEDARGVARLLAEQALPGDVVLFAPITLRNIRTTYPEDFAALTDLALARTPLESATLYGENVTPDDLAGRLSGHDRVWLLTRDSDSWRRPTDAASVAVVRRSYREARRQELPGFRVTLYLPPATPHP